MMYITKVMKQLYDVTEFDWLGFKLLDEDDLTFHHILKKEDGGKYEISNGALLTYRGHAYLHVIEEIDYETYLNLNIILKEINLANNITESVRTQIENIFTDFEEKHFKYLLKGKKKKNKHKAISKRKKSQANRKD